MSSRRVWTEQEDRAIRELVSRYGHKNWANIATLLTEQFGTTPRSGKQCRERWHNHLNPVIEKKVWSKSQEEKMFALHKVYGNKWTVIAEALPGRTDNAIKNYFYSTIRRSLRRIGKFVGSKNSTEQMKHIKPSTLSKIFEASSQIAAEENLSQKQLELMKYIKDNCETVRDSIIKFTNYKPKRNDKAAEAERAQLADVISRMVYINEVYEKIKGEEKIRRHQELMFQNDDGRIKFQEDSLGEDSQSEEEAENEATEPKTEILPRNRREGLKNLRSLGGDREVKTKIWQNSRADPVTPANDSKSVENNSQYTISTVIIKCHNLSASDHQAQQDNHINQLMQNPEFFVQLKEEEFPSLPINKRSSFTNQSPGFYFKTPSNIPFNFFQSPSTPRSFDNNLGGLGNIQNNTLQDCKALIQREIESNLKGEGKVSMAASTMLGSPGSAFSFYAFPEQNV